MLPGEDERQVAQILGFIGHRSLGYLGRPKQGVEELAVAQQFAQQQAGQRMAFFVLNDSVDFLDEMGQIDSGGADGLAGAAVDAILNQVFGFVPSVEEISHDESDGADIDVAIAVAAYHAVNRADVGAGAAAHASKHLGKYRVFGQGPPAVVEKHDVHHFFVVRCGAAGIAAGDPGDIGSDALPGGVARQHAIDQQGVVKRRQ